MLNSKVIRIEVVIRRGAQNPSRTGEAVSRTCFNWDWRCGWKCSPLYGEQRWAVLMTNYMTSVSFAGDCYWVVSLEFFLHFVIGVAVEAWVSGLRYIHKVGCSAFVYFVHKEVAFLTSVDVDLCAFLASGPSYADCSALRHFVLKLQLVLPDFGLRV